MHVGEMRDVQPQSDRPIAVFDSGIGGLTVASAIAEELPNEQIFYFGDTARCPYGDRPPAEVREFSLQIYDFLRALDVKLLVVACNTATAAALPDLVARSDIPVIGVIGPGARAAVKATSKRRRRVGVIGTAVTIASGAYAEAIHELDPQVDVLSLACPRFVPLVEAGRWDGPDVERVIRETLLPLSICDIDTLILGCTHYPLLQAPIARVMGPSVQLISSAAETAKEVQRVLDSSGLLRQDDTPPRHRFYTTGDGERMRIAVTNWLSLDAEDVDLFTVDPRLLQVRS
jgi:glutamate racemase